MAEKSGHPLPESGRQHPTGPSHGPSQGSQPVSPQSPGRRSETVAEPSAGPRPDPRIPASGPVSSNGIRRTTRDRRGRGLRTPLLPAGLPASRTRAQQFDHAVLEAVADLEERWPTELSAIEFAVDEVPLLPEGSVTPSSDVVLDGGVPLTRFSPPGVDSRGRATKARIVVYRRPLEVRAADHGDLNDLVAEVLGEQLTAVLGEGQDGA